MASRTNIMQCTKLEVEKSIKSENVFIIKSSSCVPTRNVYLVPFFNFLFYLGFFPFKTELDFARNIYCIKKYKFQQVICALVHIGTLFFMSYFTTGALLHVLSRDPDKPDIPLNIFDIISNFGMVFTAIFIMQMSWRKSNSLLKIIEGTRFRVSSQQKLNTISILVYLTGIILTLVMGILDWIVMNKYSSPPHNGTTINEISDCPNMENHTFAYIKKLATPLIALLYVYLTVFYSMSQSLFVFIALTLNQLGNDFERKLRECGFQSTCGLQKGISLYKTLRQTLHTLNLVFGNAMIGYYVSAVAYLAEAPHIVLGYQRSYEQLFMIYTAISTVIWVIASEFHYKTQLNIAKWTDRHCDDDKLLSKDRLKLLTIITEVSSSESNPIALSNKCFSVTYKNLGSMLGLIVTYGIIIFQLHNSNDNN